MGYRKSLRAMAATGDVKQALAILDRLDADDRHTKTEHHGILNKLRSDQDPVPALTRRRLAAHWAKDRRPGVQRTEAPRTANAP
jgi:hypothetical protein